MKKIIFFLCLASFAYCVRVTSGLSHEREVIPGAAYSDTVSIANTDKEPERVKAHLADYHFVASGETHFPDPGTLARSNAKWIHVKSKEFTLAPGASFKLPFTVSVPKEKLEGTYWSVLLIEPVPQKKPEELEGVGIQSVVRYAVQIVTHISGTGAVDMKVSNVEVVRKEEKTYYQFDVENTGTRMVSPNLWMDVFSASGVKEGKIEGHKTRLYPGTSVRHTLDISTLSSGKHNGLLIFDQRDADFFGLEVDFKI